MARILAEREAQVALQVVAQICGAQIALSRR
jgi:hypothetical protein